MSAVQVVLARAPTPGRCKTRLATATSDAFAVEFHEACVRDWIERPIVASRRELHVDGDAELWVEAASAGWKVTHQSEGDLEARLRRALTEAAPGDEPAVITGTDSPDLPQRFLVDALDVAARGEVAIVPALDGGFAAIALRISHQDVFSNVRWSSEATLADLVVQADHCGVRVVLLPWWPDVDTVADLRRLVLYSRLRRVSAMPWPATRALASARLWCNGRPTSA